MFIGGDELIDITERKFALNPYADFTFTAKEYGAEVFCWGLQFFRIS